MPAKVKASEKGAWELAHLQISMFPVESALDIDQKWFEEFAGTPPKQTIRKSQEYAAVGTYEAGRLHLGIDLLKFFFTAHPAAEKPDDGPPPLFPSFPGDIETSIDSFLRLVGKWLDRSHPAVKRIGFSGRLIRRAANQRAANRELKRHLPTVQFDASCTDFSFKINRPRKSKSMPGIMFNRLATWSAPTIVAILAHIEPAGTKAQKVKQSSACCLEFDISTPADRENELPRRRMKPIIRELADLAIELARKGDGR